MWVGRMNNEQWMDNSQSCAGGLRCKTAGRAAMLLLMRPQLLATPGTFVPKRKEGVRRDEWGVTSMDYHHPHPSGCVRTYR